jgi:hypothetical protein
VLGSLCDLLVDLVRKPYGFDCRRACERRVADGAEDDREEQVERVVRRPLVDRGKHEAHDGGDRVQSPHIPGPRRVGVGASARGQTYDRDNEEQAVEHDDAWPGALRQCPVEQKADLRQSNQHCYQSFRTLTVAKVCTQTVNV